MASFDIDALRAAISGVDNGSFARAAVELGRSQSAVSMQLKKLEQQAGQQLFERRGRGLVPTEAGEALLQYARRIIALNDEAARALGAKVAPETVRLGLPQDFYDDIMPATVRAFAERNADAHVSVRAGNNHKIHEDILEGRLDAAIAFFQRGSAAKGDLLCELPLLWVAHSDFPVVGANQEVPLVLFNHRCLFRQTAIVQLDRAKKPWRAALTTPSLAAVWSGLRSHFGVGVRVGHAVPDDIRDVSDWPDLPDLPTIELRLLRSAKGGSRADEMCALLREQTLAYVGSAT
ncbi:MAG: LysR family transcriptional regulator [Tateyamaria sp.]